MVAAWSSNQLARFGAGIFYGTVAVAMGFINKAVLMDFRYSNTVLTIQMAVSSIICYLLRWLGLVHFRHLDLSTSHALMPLVFFYNANVAFALAGLRTLNIPMYNVIKRLTPMFILTMKTLLTSKFPQLQVFLSVLTTVAGCFVAGIGDLGFDLEGYMLAMTSCLLQAIYLLLVEKSGGEKGLSSTELLVYNSVLSLPVLVVLVVVTGEASMAGPKLLQLTASSWWFLPNLLLSSVMGVLLNYTLFLCTLVNSALTTTIIGSMKSVASTVLGFFLLGGVQPHFLNCLGIFLNMVGGLWYTFAKYKGRLERKHSHEKSHNNKAALMSFRKFRAFLPSPAASFSSIDGLLPQREDDSLPLLEREGSLPLSQGRGDSLKASKLGETLVDFHDGDREHEHAGASEASRAQAQDTVLTLRSPTSKGANRLQW